MMRNLGNNHLLIIFAKNLHSMPLQKWEKQMKGIEAEFQRDEYKIWEYLQENDLLITKSGNNRYIICVKDYSPTKRSISVKFIYSLETDSFYSRSGYESPDVVERSPNQDELAQLNSNFDYLTYTS